MNRWNLVLVVGLLLHAGAALAADRYALLVGVANYDHPELRKPLLKYTINDATAMSILLSEMGYKTTLMVDGSKIPLLLPTKAKIEAQMLRILRGAKPGDSILIGLSGHGLQFGKEGYFCASDTRPFRDETATMVSISSIYNQLERSNAEFKVLLVDACRNDPTPGKSPGITDVPSPKGVAALLSCSRGQKSFEDDEHKHGVFFRYVLDGLRGEAANKRGEVTFEGLSAHVRSAVPSRVYELFPLQKPDQSPNLKADLEGVPPVLAKLELTPPKQNLEGTRPGEERADNGLQLAMCWIPPGQFKMGSPKSEEERIEYENQVDVTISRGFWMGKYEVTQGEWEKLMGSNPSWFSRRGGGKDEVAGEDTSRFPVENVSWDDTQRFCQALTGQEQAAGRLPLAWSYRLPTEAEWEYACRAGTTTPFHFGRSLNGDSANCQGSYPYGTSTKGPYIDRTTRAGSYVGNAWGLRDVHGNVWEWCQDSWDGTALLTGGRDPQSNIGEYRVARSGGLDSPPAFCRSANRDYHTPEDRVSNLGFRLVRGPSSPGQ